MYVVPVSIIFDEDELGTFVVPLQSPVADTISVQPPVSNTGAVQI